MPAFGRLGDQAECPADSHGCLGCAHPVKGPAVKGSDDVFVNGSNALRVGDPGVHSSCCGPNTWQAAKGAPGVFANARAVHRKTDDTTHCGGAGHLVEGSPDVFVGNHSGGEATTSPAVMEQRQIRFVDPFGNPVQSASLKARVVVEGEHVRDAELSEDWIRERVDKGGAVEIELVAEE